MFENAHIRNTYADMYARYATCMQTYAKQVPITEKSTMRKAYPHWASVLSLIIYILHPPLGFYHISCLPRGEGRGAAYSKNLNNRQTLAGFVDNYDLIYKILQKHSKKTHPQGCGAPLWGAAEGHACVFFISPSVFLNIL